jgi:hypothetical protein
MSGLRDRGIDLLGARYATLRQLVSDMPPTLAAAALDTSPETAEHHAAAGLLTDQQFAHDGVSDYADVAFHVMRVLAS